ncbi:hypothetical protein GIB67_029061 [Kingdonia uniflora]|uniref:mitogen-activated protein kinase kinase kinase n=1 Tax=Kingdonia uniflora TaxID=39325 RepID=A0A7J7N6W8_9MAGN|nr:hypothetical protein GIB67_029061 [Kingdonia uniflora]
MIQDLVESVRRSIVFRGPDGGDEVVGVGLVDKIGYCIRKSRVGVFSKPLLHPPLSPSSQIYNENNPPIRWRKGELIGCGAFGRVYMGMNLDSGELLAVKQVLIASNNASKEKAQAHIRELEEEVKLLKNLSHPNIVRYLGTAREEGTLNILLEFVPGGSISSLLGKFGSFPEAVIRMYTKQLLLGLEYLHRNGIMHRDIKGANILVDNKGCIKLADFGASKQVVELATITGAKSMKGTPYWMAPEVILQTGHNFSADIWSVGCTVIEMATGKPPWSEKYQEVAALFHIGTTKSHPPIPEHLSLEAKDFLLKCLQKEPNLRSAASELLQHPFVTGLCSETHSVLHISLMGNSAIPATTAPATLKNSANSAVRPRTACRGFKDVCDMNSVRCSTIYPEKFSEASLLWGTTTDDDDMCQMDDINDFIPSGNFNSNLASGDFNKSFNPMCEPDDWPSNFDRSPEPNENGMNLGYCPTSNGATCSPEASEMTEKDFTFPCGPSVSEDDDEVTESKIRAFLDEKALDLKKMQTPLYEEYYNTLNGSSPLGDIQNAHDENGSNYLKLPPKSRSPSRGAGGTLLFPSDCANTRSPGSCSRRVSNVDGINDQSLQEIPFQQLNERRGLLDSQQRPISPSFSERQRKWKEELDQELERKRAINFH